MPRTFLIFCMFGGLSACGASEAHYDRWAGCTADAAVLVRIGPKIGMGSNQNDLLTSASNFLSRARYEGKKLGWTEKKIDEKIEAKTKLLFDSASSAEEPVDELIKIAQRNLQCTKEF